MRPGQNKRMRGRSINNNSNRKGPNPLTRSYESNGPDVKIRGTAHHIGEKYLQLARDAQSSGDPVMAESYLQHAEHYFRLIASAQLAQQQAAYGYQRPPGEQIEQEDDSDDDDFGNMPDRFASPTERAAPVPPPQPIAQQPHNGGDRQPYEPRAERYDRGNGQQPTLDRSQGDRQNGDRQTFDRSNYDRQQDRSQERSYDNRNGRGERNGYQDRNQQRDRGFNQDRPPQQQDRPGQQDRTLQDRAQDRPYDQRAPRDYDNRSFRGNRAPRENGRESGMAREPREPAIDEPANGLPAFITAPTRVPTEGSNETEPAMVETAPVGDTAEDAGFHLRPRRRRRPKPDPVEGQSDGHETPAGDPVGD